MPEMGRAFVEIIRLRLPAADPADTLECGERWSRRGRVRCLAVVDEQHSVALADALHAVRKAGVGAKRVFDTTLRQPQCKAGSNRGGPIFKVVWPFERWPAGLIILAKEFMRCEEIFELNEVIALAEK